MSVSLVSASFASMASALSAHGVAVRSSCAAPIPDQIGCDAQVLVSRDTGRPIHPEVKHERAHAASAGQAAPEPMTPAYLQQAYDLSFLSATRGSGDTVAVVAVYNDPSAASDLATFRSTYGLPACTVGNGCFQQLNEQGQTSPLPSIDWGWAQEEAMDLDAVSSLCPNCKIDLFEASAPDAYDVQTAATAAIAAGANQVSISGAGEYSGDPFGDFSAPGVSILAASGDAGVIPTGYANYPAALPFVTAVGGTSLQPDSARAPAARGVTESAWNSSGSGCDTQEQPLAYQPSDGCDGRMYSDVSADADPATGLTIFDSQAGGWLDGGGTSLATPLVAAFEAVTGVDGSTPQWAYTDEADLNDPATGSTGSCLGLPAVLCNAGPGYSGPTGAGSISGQLVNGAPGIGEPAFGGQDDRTYVTTVGKTEAQLLGGIYPNGEDTTYYWQYGKTASYSSRTPGGSADPGTAPVWVTGYLRHLTAGTTYHYRLVAANPTGKTYGYDYTFTTAGHAPASKRARAREHEAKRHQQQHRRNQHHRKKRRQQSHRLHEPGRANGK